MPDSEPPTTDAVGGPFSWLAIVRGLKSDHILAAILVYVFVAVRAEVSVLLTSMRDEVKAERTVGREVIVDWTKKTEKLHEETARANAHAFKVYDWVTQRKADAK